MTRLSPPSAVQEAAHPLTGDTTDFDPLLRRIGDAHFVLIGEASHGTHESLSRQFDAVLHYDVTRAVETI